MAPVIVVHGGAGGPMPPKSALLLRKQGVENAAEEGYRILTNGGTALDAVEAAVKVMEDNSIFNAGFGSSLTLDGTVEMDALLMEGAELKAGAVAAVSRVKNPIALAKKVMAHTDHVLLVGEGAHRFALSAGVPLVPNETLISEKAIERLHSHPNFLAVVDSMRDHDTVGAVAVDSFGHVASAVSTGGLTAQMGGRVGDSPLPGAGAWADDASGAVCATGHGESIMRVCLCRHIAGLLQQGLSAQDATVSGLEYMRTRIRGYGGAICVTPDGQVGVHFTTPFMSWASRGTTTTSKEP